MHETWAINTELQPFIERARVERAQAVQGLLRGFASLFGAARRYWRKHRMIAELQELDDRLLKDIGLYRNDIIRLAEDRWGSAAATLPEDTAAERKPATVVALPKQPQRVKRAA